MTKQLSDKQKASLREAIAEAQQCRRIVQEMTQIVSQMEQTSKS